MLIATWFPPPWLLHVLLTLAYKLLECAGL